MLPSLNGTWGFRAALNQQNKNDGTSSYNGGGLRLIKGKKCVNLYLSLEMLSSVKYVINQREEGFNEYCLYTKLEIQLSHLILKNKFHLSRCFT